MMKTISAILMVSVPIARCGYYEYAKVTEVFEMTVPGLSEDIMTGLEGNSRKFREKYREDRNGDDGVMRGEDAESEKKN